MVKLAIVVQPSLKISGGDQVINTLYKGFKQKYDINLVCLCPINLDNKFKRCFKFFFKFFRSKFSKFGNKPQLIWQSSLKKYDYVLVGWNEDCASILKTNYPKDRIIHICQSFETWANDVYSSRIIYNNKIHRLSVAKWLSDCMQKQSLNNFFIGNCIQDSFFENQKNINFSKKKYITYLSYKGWFKNSIESALLSEKLAGALNLSVIRIGKDFSKKEIKTISYSNLRPNQIREVFDKTKFVVSLSHYEGLPLFIIEALSRGCIAILSNIKAHNEIFKKYPNQVLLVPHAPIMLSNINDYLKQLKNLNFNFDIKNFNEYKTEKFVKRSIQKLDFILTNKTND